MHDEPPALVIACETAEAIRAWQWSTITVAVVAWADSGAPVVHQVGCVSVCMPDVGFQVRIAGGHTGDVVIERVERAGAFNPEAFWWVNAEPQWRPQPHPSVEYFEWFVAPNAIATPKSPGVTLMLFDVALFGRAGETYRIEPIDSATIFTVGGVPTFAGEFTAEFRASEVRVVDCYADCDTSTGVGVLDIFDFLCFQDRFEAGDPYACDCDTSTGPGVCDGLDFCCFQAVFSTGCDP